MVNEKITKRMVLDKAYDVKDRILDIRLSNVGDIEDDICETLSNFEELIGLINLLD